jgi:hypothetical protein
VPISEEGPPVADFGATFETSACPTVLPANSEGAGADLLIASHAFESRLSEFLRRRRYRGRWAAFYRTEFLGVRRRQKDLYRKARRMGKPADKVVVRWVHRYSLPPSA